MRPDTRRRTAVLAVCLAGVVALYWVPTAVRSPERTSHPASPAGAPTLVPVSASSVPDPAHPSADGPDGQPADLPSGADERGGAPDSASARPTTGSTSDPSPVTSTDTGEDRPRPTRPTEATTAPTTAPATDPSGGATTGPTSAAPSPTSSATGRAPGPVRDLHLVQADYEGLTVGWDPAPAAVRYTVSLNGYEVGGTTGTEVALRWFNDDMSEHFVQVRPVGPDGTSGRDAAFLRVSRPDSPSPEPSPTTEPTPSADPSTPAATPSGEPNAATPAPTASATR